MYVVNNVQIIFTSQMNKKINVLMIVIIWDINLILIIMYVVNNVQIIYINRVKIYVLINVIL